MHSEREGTVSTASEAEPWMLTELTKGMQLSRS